MLMALQRQGGPCVYRDPLDLETIAIVNGLIETQGRYTRKCREDSSRRSAFSWSITVLTSCVRSRGRTSTASIVAIPRDPRRPARSPTLVRRNERGFCVDGQSASPLSVAVAILVADLPGAMPKSPRRSTQCRRTQQRPSTCVMTAWSMDFDGSAANGSETKRRKSRSRSAPSTRPPRLCEYRVQSIIFGKKCVPESRNIPLFQ